MDQPKMKIGLIWGKIILKINSSPYLWILIRVEIVILIASLIPWGIRGNDRYTSISMNAKPFILRLISELNYFEMCMIQFIILNFLAGLFYFIMIRRRKKKL